jgi:tripartite-type tricarboxylate transporter receptor subunit TctC
MSTSGTNHLRALLGASLATLAAAASPSVRAQAAFPTKPIRLITGFPAGSATDGICRAIAEPMRQKLGQPVIVENRAGANGAVGAAEVARAAPDGHTLFFGTATAMSYTPSIKKNPPYDSIADFTPISNLCIFTFYLMVQPSLPVNTLAEFVAYAKANPGKIAYATGNSTGILSIAQLAQANKLDMTHVPYKGEAQAVIDMVGGRVQAMFATPAVLPQLLKEKFKMVAVLLPRRTTSYPDVPTMSEAGQPLVNILPWGGLFGPARMPRDIVERISRDFNVIMRRPDVAEQYEKLGLLPTPSTPEVLGTLVKDQLGAWSKSMRAAGIELE